MDGGSLFSNTESEGSVWGYGEGGEKEKGALESTSSNYKFIPVSFRLKSIFFSFLFYFTENFFAPWEIKYHSKANTNNFRKYVGLTYLKQYIQVLRCSVEE